MAASAHEVSETREDNVMSANLYLGICATAFLLIGLFFSIQFFRGRMTWPQVRRMGVPMTLFGWMIVIYYLALFEGVYGPVGFILDLPVWIDVLLFLVILGLSMAVYFKLNQRKKFKPTLFKAIFLIPLSIPGLHTAARLIPSKAPVEIVQSLPVGASTKAISSFPQSKKIGDSGYMVEFPNSQKKGTFGDWLTAKRLTAQGYEKLESKPNKIYGIDGVYVRYEKGSSQKVQDILIVEDKVDKGRLNPEQMTDQWIEKAVKNMLANDRTRFAGELIRANSGLVRKELWHHDLDKGSTVIHRLDGEANIIPESKRTEHYIDNSVRKRCESKQSNIVCHPVIQ